MVNALRAQRGPYPVAPPTGLNPSTPLSGEPQFCPQILRKTRQFEVIRQLEIIDCSHNHGDPPFHFSLGQPKRLTPEEIEKTVWSNIDRAFAQPISRHDEVAAYAGTQIIAELFKSAGYDGIAYRSNFGKDGHNVALFDIDAARLLNCQLHRVEAVDMEFSVQDNMYFMKDTID